jgi:hypothetical protein
MNKTGVAADPAPQRLFEIPENGSAEPVATLRGARIEADSARVGSVLAIAVLAVIATSAVVFFVVGGHKNAQISELHEHGVAVRVTVTKCLGLMGGSGSSPAGYACTGTFELDGRHFVEAIPGTVLYQPGTMIAGVAASNGSGLFAPTNVLATERASWTVFIVPTVLLLAFALLASAWVIRRKRSRKRAALFRC